jgi:hypothetical protein
MHGFKRIDALDPSRGMLEVAKKKKLYRCYTYSYLENGVLTDRNGKKTNYCNKEKETVPLLYMLLPCKWRLNRSEW